MRGIFYQMESRGFIKKTEEEYKRTVVRLLSVMRKAHNCHTAGYAIQRGT